MSPDIATPTHSHMQAVDRDTTIWKVGGRGRDKVKCLGLRPESCVALNPRNSSKKYSEEKVNKQHSLLPRSYRHYSADWMVKECCCAGQFPGHV